MVDSMHTLLEAIGLFAAAFVAGAINSVAGGGSLISFPALVAFGQPAILANATSTAALWPGALASALAYRRQGGVERRLLLTLLVPSAVGGILGAYVLVNTPPAVFDVVVPYLVLFATVLFACRKPIARWTGTSTSGPDHLSLGRGAWGFTFQLFVAIYGGYFGAGIGILMLASLSLMGMHDIHRMNGLKTWLGAIMNVIAFAFFAAKGLVVWPLAAVMTAGAVTGGYLGARTAQRLSPVYIQYFVIAVGAAVSIWLFVR